MVMKRDHGMSVSPMLKPLVPKNRLMWRGLLRVPDQAGEAHEGEHEADRRDDLGDERRVGETRASARVR